MLSKLIYSNKWITEKLLKKKLWRNWFTFFDKHLEKILKNLLKESLEKLMKKLLEDFLKESMKKAISQLKFEANPWEIYKIILGRNFKSIVKKNNAWIMKKMFEWLHEGIPGVIYNTKTIIWKNILFILFFFYFFYFFYYFYLFLFFHLLWVASWRFSQNFFWD